VQNRFRPYPLLRNRRDAEILQDNLTQARVSLRASPVVPDTGETIANGWARSLAAHGPTSPRTCRGGAADRARVDSLMAVRIKNRVEYDFDLPPIH